MSGLIGFNRSRGEYKAGDIIQTKQSRHNGDFSTSTSQQVVFGCQSAANVIHINERNHVLVHVHFQVYTGGNAGGYCGVSRGIGMNNNSSNTTRTSWYTHDDFLNSDGGSMDPHVYISSGGHTYFHYAYNFLDTNADKYGTAPRYALTLTGHAGGPSVTIAGSWNDTVVWILSEIQA